MLINVCKMLTATTAVHKSVLAYVNVCVCVYVCVCVCVCVSARRV